jgi:hypothetical protein
LASAKILQDNLRDFHEPAQMTFGYQNPGGSLKLSGKSAENHPIINPVPGKWY